jgi:hypothetical protein
MPTAGFEPKTPASERPQTVALHRVATVIGYVQNIQVKLLKTFQDTVVTISTIKISSVFCVALTACRQIEPSFLSTVLLPFRPVQYVRAVN